MTEQHPSGPGPPHYRCFTIILRHNALGRTPLDEWSARRKDLYLHNTQHSQQTDIHTPAGFEPAIPACERPQTRTLDRAGTGVDMPQLMCRFLTAKSQVRSQNFLCGCDDDQMQMGLVCSVYLNLYLGYIITPKLLIHSLSSKGYGISPLSAFFPRK